MPWSLAHLELRAQPLREAISSAAIRRIGDFAVDITGPMLLWTSWRTSSHALSLALFEVWTASGRLTHAEPFGIMLLENDWWKDLGWELDLLDRLHEVLPVRSVAFCMMRLGFRPAMPLSTVSFAYQKIARLVDAVEAAVGPGSPSGILSECETFAADKGQWLKVAGLEKAEILSHSFLVRPPRMHELAVEFGIFIGYTAVRLGDCIGRLRAGIGLMSLEVNPVHVCIARHFLDFAHLASVSEVKVGQAKDALGLVAEEASCRSLAFSFMDHRGTIFHSDFNAVEKLDLFARRTWFVADNALNPGSPVFLWGGMFWKRQVTTALALQEFLSEHEDWQAIVAVDSGSALPNEGGYPALADMLGKSSVGAPSAC